MAKLEVRFHPAAVVERAALAPRERVALANVIEKLEALGIALGTPHTSKVRGARDLRELRPRAGNSPTRAFYRRVANTFVVAAVGPEANVDPRAFKRAVAAAQMRLEEIGP